MTPWIFRGLILAVWALTALCVVVTLFTRQYLPPQLINYLDSVTSGGRTSFDWIMMGFSFFLLLLLVIASVGLYKFKGWGRTLFLWINVVSLAILPSHSVSIESGFVQAVYYLSVLLEGGLLFTMYLPPIGPLFEHGPQLCVATGDQH
jgi:hypothetical protein